MTAHATPEVTKPHLRGWLHAVAAPLVLAANIVLVILAPGGTSRLVCLVYLVGGVTLFGTSALYHRLSWSPRHTRLLKRLDHSNIYLMIASTYTPIVVLGLDGSTRTALLWFVWVGAVLGIVIRLFWLDAPRALYTGLYVALGWSVFVFIGDFFHRNGSMVGLLVLAGGVFYTLGAVVYALKRPDPVPGWFGFHEVFHTFTVVAWISQYAAVWQLIRRQ